jgi:hypothetical protein
VSSVERYTCVGNTYKASTICDSSPPRLFQSLPPRRSHRVLPRRRSGSEFWTGSPEPSTSHRGDSGHQNIPAVMMDGTTIWHRIGMRYCQSPRFVLDLDIPYTIQYTMNEPIAYHTVKSRVSENLGVWGRGIVGSWAYSARTTSSSLECWPVRFRRCRRARLGGRCLDPSLGSVGLR